jgi:hypothetical protein
MKMILEDPAGEVMELPRHQKLALARLLIDLDLPSLHTNEQTASETEVQARQRAVTQGPDTIPDRHIGYHNQPLYPADVLA